MQFIYCTKFRDRVFIGNAPTLENVIKLYGKNVLEIWLLIQINDLNEKVGAKVKLNISQMKECASLIIERHSSLNVAEIMFFFRGLKCGDFSEFYGVVDLQKIMKAFSKFYDTRNLELDKIHQKETEEKKRKEEEEHKKNSISYLEYIDNLKEEIKKGNKNAEKLLKLADENLQRKIKIEQEQERKQKTREKFIEEMAEFKERLKEDAENGNSEAKTLLKNYNLSEKRKIENKSQKNTDNWKENL